MQRRTFFKVVDDMEFPNRWALDDPVSINGIEVDWWVFCEGEWFDHVHPVSIAVRIAGKPLAFTYSLLGVPVVSQQLAAIIRRACPDSVQLIPAAVEGCEQTYWVINPLTLYECVDDEASITTKWTEADERPDKVGQYRMVIKLALDGKRIGNDPMFRVKEWEVALVVSEDLKAQMESVDTTGITFRQLEVSD